MAAYATPITEPIRPLVAVKTLTRDEVMTAPEVAELLRIPKSTVYELARRGELPARRLGRTWRFLRPRLAALLPLAGQPCWPAKGAGSGRRGEHLRRPVAGDMAVWPRDLELAITFDEPLNVHQRHRDQTPFFVELDAVAFGRCLGVRRKGAASYPSTLR